MIRKKYMCLKCQHNHIAGSRLAKEHMIYLLTPEMKLYESLGLKVAVVKLE